MAKALKTSAEGRVCEFPECRQLLSIYNHETYCRVHLQKELDKEEYRPHKHI